MKEQENYLWDKTGEDAEIAGLENALAAFRYRETALPALPAKILPFQLKTVEKPAAVITRRRLSYAFAACAALVLMAFGLMFQFSNSETSIENDLAQKTSIAASINQEIENDSIEESERTTFENVEFSPEIKVSKQIIKQFEKTMAGYKTKPSAVKTRPSAVKTSNQNQTLARIGENENPSAALTDEEQHAYDQLMLALSVTSKQLKIVKDKLNGVEEKNIVSNDER